MYFEWLNKSLQVVVAVTEGIQSANLSVKLSPTKYPIYYIIKLFAYLSRTQSVGTDTYFYLLSS